MARGDWGTSARLGWASVRCWGTWWTWGTCDDAWHVMTVYKRGVWRTGVGWSGHRGTLGGQRSDHFDGWTWTFTWPVRDLARLEWDWSSRKGDRPGDAEHGATGARQRGWASVRCWGTWWTRGTCDDAGHVMTVYKREVWRTGVGWSGHRGTLGGQRSDHFDVGPWTFTWPGRDLARLEWDWSSRKGDRLGEILVRFIVFYI